jgi:TPR repeat protein
MSTHRLRLSALATAAALFGLVPAIAHADWNQANDEANRQRMMSEMRANAAANDRANEASMRRQQQDFENRSRASSGGGGSSNSSGSSAGGYSSPSYHDSGPASVVETYTFKIRKQETEGQTVARISREAEAGQVQSEFNLARIYYAGYGGIARDDALARKWFGAATKQGHVPAEAQYGAMVYNGRGGPADTADGLAHLKHAAENGEHYAEALYGFFALDDLSKVDPTVLHPELVAMLERAAEAGELVAQIYLSQVVYQDGVGTPADGSKALKFLRLGVAQDDTSSIFILGKRYLIGFGVEKDQAKGLELVKRCLDRGYGDAEALYGFFGYVRGDLGVPKNLDMGLKLLRQATEKGSGDGAYYLGMMTEEGHGVAKDASAAAALYKRAADNGSAEGKARYGQALIVGAGIPKDIGKGVELVRQATNRKSDIAQEILGRLYYFGVGVPKDRRLAMTWLTKAADQGNSDAIEEIKTIARLDAKSG